MSRRGAGPILTALLSTILATPAAMGQATPAAPSATTFVGSDTPSSVARLSIAASVLRSMVNPMAAERERWDVLRPTNAPGAFLTLDQVFQEYQFRVSRDRLDAMQYGAAGLVLQGAIIAGGAFVPAGTLPSLAQGLGSAGTSAGVSSVTDELTKHGEAQTSRWLEDALAGLVNGGRLPRDLSSLRGMSPEVRRGWLMDERLVDDLLARAGEVRPEDRAIVEGMALRALNDRVRRAEAIQLDRDREQDEAITGLAKQIRAVARTLNDFRVETAAGLEGIRNEQAAMNDRLKALEGYSRETRADLEFVQRFMFDRMEPEEQLAALRGGMFRDMPEPERARLTARIEVVEQRKKLMAAVGDFSQGAAALTRIADRLGVDRNVVDALGKAAEASQAAQKVAAGLMSGGIGYLAAADAVVGLVFGAGPDPGAQRHQQVMQALGRISEQVAVVQDMVRAVGQQVEEVRRLQLATLEAVSRLSEQVQANHRELIAKIAQIRADLVPIQSVVNELLFTEIEQCWTFRRILREAGFARERAISPTFTYAELRAINQEEQFGGICRRGLRIRLGDPLGPNITYALNRFSTPNTEAESFLQYVFNPTWVVLRDYVLGPERISLYARSFTTPVVNLRAVEAKRSTVLGPKPPDVGQAFAGVGATEIARRLGTALSDQAIQRHACFLAFVHPFFEMEEALRDPNPARLVSLETTSIDGRELLRATIRLVETAIAQQVMLGGDVALADLDRIWQDGAAPRAEGETEMDFARRASPWERLRPALRGNRTLRHNLILQAVSRAVRERGNMVLYGAAYGLQGDPSLLLAMLREPQFVLRWVPTPADRAPRPDHQNSEASTGWQLRIGDDFYPLPTPLELTSGELAQTPALRGLIDLRNELAVELEGYLAPARLSATARATLRGAVLRVSAHMTGTSTPREATRPCGS